MGDQHLTHHLVISSSCFGTPLETEKGLTCPPFVVSASIESRNNKQTESIMVDCGATGKAFIDPKLALSLNLKFQDLKNPRPLQMFDGSEASAGRVTQIVHIKLRIGLHSEHLSCFVTPLPNQKLILGLPWLKTHNPQIDWVTETLHMNSEHCRTSCFPAIPLSSRDRTTFSVSAAAFATAAKEKGAQVFAASIEDIKKALSKYDKNHQETDPSTKVPVEYHDFLDVWSQKEADRLPPHRHYDHKIELEEGKTPPFGPLYSMSREELQVLQKYLEANLKKGFI